MCHQSLVGNYVGTRVKTIYNTVTKESSEEISNMRYEIFLIKGILIIVDICTVINKDINGIIITKSRAYGSFNTSSSPKSTNM